MGGVFRKPVAVDSFQSLHEEANRLINALRSLVLYTREVGGVSVGIHQRYGSIHAQILQIQRILSGIINKEQESRRIWFQIWQQDISVMEATYDSIRRAGLSTIQELDEPLIQRNLD